MINLVGLSRFRARTIARYLANDRKQDLALSREFEDGERQERIDEQIAKHHGLVMINQNDKEVTDPKERKLFYKNWGKLPEGFKQYSGPPIPRFPKKGF